MNNLAVVGAQWGDEGKAKIVDWLSQKASIVARFQGGANAGHTVVHQDQRYVFHLIPSGILHPGVICIIGNGAVIDPHALTKELTQLDQKNIDWRGRLFISARAHLVLPFHKALDEAAESNSQNAIGTTKRGIGPCYRTKAERFGVLVADLLHPFRLKKKIERALQWIQPQLKEKLSADEIQSSLEPCLGFITPLIADTSAMLQKHIESSPAQGGILFEGAQGAMLDIDHGTYPYVTSSTTLASGALSGLGISAKALHRILGISKAYTTRVGEGGFPTEDSGEIGNKIQNIGHEFGATTGRPRRCGWLDLVALRYAVQLNGMDSLALTKVDILDTFPEILACVAYEYQGKVIHRPPLHPEDIEECKPIYQHFKGWQTPLNGICQKEFLPQETNQLIEFIEKYIQIPVSLISTGPKRADLIELSNPWS